MTNGFVLGIYDYVLTKYDYKTVFNTWSAFTNTKITYDMLSEVCEVDLGTKGFSTLMAYPKDYKFDLVLYDLPHGLCLYPLVDRFGSPPVIGVSPFQLPLAVSSEFGNNFQTSYVPYYNAELTDDMSLLQRMFNSFYYYSEAAYYHWVYKPEQTQIAKKHFGGDIGSVDQFIRRISIVLANIDPNLNYPEPLPSNIISVGGVHIKPPKPLEKVNTYRTTEPEAHPILF